MKRLLIFVFTLWLPTCVSAQFIEDFSDGDLTENPTWEGEVEKFVVNAENQLQLNAPEAGTAQLVVPVATGDSTSWEFWVRLDFAPSGSNFSRIYLASDVPDLTGSLNGYFVKIGGISGSNDAIELFRQTGTATELLISGTPGAAGTDPVLARVQVIRDGVGNWSLGVDYTGGSDFMQEGTAVDDTHPMGSYFGLVCDFTATRSNLFFFDDMRIAPLFEDTTPPEVAGLTVTSPTEILLQFSEVLATAPATTTSNYSLSGGINVTTASADGTQVTLSLDSELVSMQDYQLSVQNLTDEAGNVLADTTLAFSYTRTEMAQPYDILITEIMANPSLPLGLPDAEFVELFNRSAVAIDLEGYIFADPTSEVLLPAYVLLPGERVILHETDAGDFTPFGESLPLDNFPNLNNGSDDLEILRPDGTTIHTVHYTEDWYGDNDKGEGGFSLEMINTAAPCDITAANWRGSDNGNGGTPGQANSVADTRTDETAAQLVRAFPTGENTLQLIFDEAIDRTAAADFGNYNLDGLVLRDAFAEPPLFTTVQLVFDAQFETSVLYELEIDENLADCIGNEADTVRTASFALPELPEPGDVVINEVLFNPESGGSDFVEIYNRSEKILNAGDLILANRDDNQRFDQVRPVAEDFLIFPNSYLVLTEDPQDILQRYNTTQADFLVETDLPAYANEEGTVVLYRADPVAEVILDELTYSEDWHFALLDDVDGVSLERIDPEQATQSSSNWQSAAASVGFASPTVQNSQFVQVTTPAQDNFFTIPNTTFSPDGDGFEDVLLIQYQFDNTGYAATTRIFDVAGRLLHTLTQNELLPQDGFLKWDGLATDGTRARTGIYIVWVEYFTPEGDVRKFQETVVLARRLD